MRQSFTHSLVAMIVDLDLAAEDVDHALPLQVIRELAETLPLAVNSRMAVIILLLLDLPRLFVASTHGPDVVHTGFATAKKLSMSE